MNSCAVLPEIYNHTDNAELEEIVNQIKALKEKIRGLVGHFVVVR